MAVLLADQHASAAQAPPLQLPWPTNHQHRIYGGNTYGCDTHTLQTAPGGQPYIADYFAIDFQFGPIDGSPLDVSAVAAGTVVYRANGLDGFGNKVVVQTDLGGYYTVYAHFRLSNPWGPGISVGTEVKQGQLLGYAGNTGGPYDVHLHYHMQSGLSAYRSEPMSRVTNFGWYGDSVENGTTWCGDTPNDPSPYWTSWPPYATIEGGLIRGSDDKVYIISAGQKRWITSSAVFNNCGYRWTEIMALPDSAIGMIPGTGTVTSGPPCPETLARVTGTSPVYYVDALIKRWVSSSTVFNGCDYDWGDIVGVSQSALNNYYTADPINAPPCPHVRDPWYNEALIEGSLIQIEGDDPVYVIAGGQKRHITSSQVLSNCGYKTNDKIAVPGTIVNLIPTGDPITSTNSPPCPYTLITGSGPEVYVMLSSLKRHVWSRPVFDACGYV